MFAAGGAAAFVWLLVPRTLNSKSAALRVLGTSAVALIGIGALTPIILYCLPESKKEAVKTAANETHSTGSCNDAGDFRPLDAEPRGMVFTFVDLAPRLITVTHHDSITGPYHRNGEQIADVMNAFRRNADEARALIAKYHSDYVLTCPASSETTIFTKEAPRGFYAQLEAGRVPKWLSPVGLPKGSPFRMWRVAG